jgi:predicted nucleotidyltransferase
MKAVGLITEYNPFHNGHLYHIEEAKRITGADYAVVVMSGNFVQRGAPAFLDKYSRTKMALSCGADIVFELPVCFSTSSAELFALGAVSLLDKLGIVEFLCFGSECGDITLLEKAAAILLEEPEQYKSVLSQFIKNGKTFPAARMEAIKTVSQDISDSVLASPNNILGTEYIKALLKLSSNMKPVTIQRISADYHSLELSSLKEASVSSATAIRKNLREKKSPANLKNQIPEPVYKILLEEYLKTYPVFDEDYSLLLQYKLMQETSGSLAAYTDITPDLARRISDIKSQGLTFTELTKLVKTRQWTLTRINRGLIHVLLNLYTNNLNTYKAEGYTQYARLLGFKKTSSHLIREIVKIGKIPVITKMADAGKQLDNTGLTMLKEDIFASHLYNQVVYNKYGTTMKDEYTRGVIIV